MLDLNYNILLGRFLLNNLPSIRPRSIRLFVCAPYSDTSKEISYLFNNIFPKLREYSISRYGLEFQAVNLNWDLEFNSDILNESLNEIEKCQSQSIGMTFLSLIGDDYGTPHIPLWIERNNFKIILKCLQDKNNNNKNYHLLERYFKLNLNYLSNRYELQIDREFSTNEATLFDLIKTGAKHACDNKLIEEKFLNELNETILQKLMINGVFKNDLKQDRVFSFVRINSSSQKNTNDYPTKINTFEYLRDREINYHIPAEQIYRIKADKIDDEYLKNFGFYYKKNFEKLIDKFIRENPEFGYDSIYEQVLYNLNYIKLNKINEISPRTQFILKQLSDYVLDDTYRQPFILTGDLGSGKTSVMATLASNLFLQLSAYDGSNKHSIVVRFVGIDGRSNYLRALLRSICTQLIYIKTLSLKEMEKVPKKLNELKVFFKKFLTENFDINDPKRKLIILIDSLQDLTKNDNSFKLDWLPKHLNPMCKLILTVSSESDELIERLTRKFTNPKSYANLDCLNQEQGEYMIKKLFNTKNYRLEQNQYELILNLIKTKPILSLHLKLLSEEFLNWKSYTSIDDCILKDTLEKSVEYFLNNLELKHGYLLVKHIISYLTIAQNGFSENELQDILSLDNELMKEFKTNEMIKPNDHILRMPWFYILKVLDSLKNHLLIKPHHGIYTICWRHSIFKEIIKKKYFVYKNFVTYLHKNVSEYYLGIWSSPKMKPLKYEKTLRSTPDPRNPQQLIFDKPIIKKFKIEVDRLVPIQPILYEDFHTHVKQRYNLRKLSQLPYHLIGANMIKELYEHVFFNIDWIYSKINAFDLYSLLYDFDMYKNDPEVNLVCESLKMSESAIDEDPKLLFSQLVGRLLPFYNVYDRIHSLIDQCDKKSASLNPLIPIGQLFNSPSWVYQETLDLDIHPTDSIQIELLESDFNGQILLNKKANSTMCKFFDINLLEFKNDVFIGKEKVYCSKNGDFVCIIENSSKLLIRRIESGEFYGTVEFEPCEIGHVHMSSNYACLILRKIPSPLIIDLKSRTCLKTLPYQTCFCTISPDESVLIVHSEKMLNYHLIPGLNRVICLESIEIPEKIVFFNKNKKLFVLSKDTKQITFFGLIIEKKLQKSSHVLQDRDIFDMKMSFDESMLIVCSLYCVYVLELIDDDEVRLKFKFKTSDIETFINLNSKLNDYEKNNQIIESSKNSNSNSNCLVPKNTFNGFGCTQNNKFIYASMYTYLICYDASNGSILRLFQSTLSANRIIKSFSSNLTDYLLSLLDNGKFILWNLKSFEYKQIKFHDLRIFNDKIEKCMSPKIEHNSSKNTNYCLSYTKSYPDAKVCNLKKEFSVKSIIKTCLDEKSDNSLTSLIKFAIIDDNAKFCFIVNDVEDFNGKRLPEEKDFYKKICSVIDLKNDNRLIESFSYVARKNSRLEIKACFVHKKNLNNETDETYLIMKQVSCINDFDPYCQTSLDWTEFETYIKIYGPINSQSTKLELYDEFKLNGESLERNFCINKDFYFGSLMQECNKLYDKLKPGIIKAKRYEIHLNIYEIFESKLKSLKVQLFSLSEFLNHEENSSSGKNLYLDLRLLNDEHFFILYSTHTHASGFNQYEYDLENLCFKRNIKVDKSALIYDPKSNQIVKKFSNIFSPDVNIEKVILSTGLTAIDEFYNLYDLNSGKLIRNMKKNDKNLSLNFKFTHFLFNGRYLIVSSSDKKKLLILRCYDSTQVASIRLNDEISYLNIGELDRTILVGTVNGSVLPIKLVIDLEHNEAINKYIKYYRRSKKIENKEILLTKNNLENDIKRVIHSAHAHRDLKSRELRLSSALSDKNSIMSTNLNKAIHFHNGVVKSNLSTITVGIKRSENNSRACLIQ